MSADLEAGAQCLHDVLDGRPHVAAWLGSPGPDRKYTVAAQDAKTKELLAFAKVSDSSNPRSRELIDHEATVLAGLSKTALRKNVPKLLWASSDSRRSILVTRAVRGDRLHHSRPVPVRAVRVLAELGSMNTYEQGTSEPGNALVPSHGDFVPWNIIEQRSGELCFIDWEFYGHRPPNWDLVHYEVQRAAFFSRLPVAPTARKIRERLETLLGPPESTWQADRAISDYCSGHWDGTDLAVHARVRDLRRALSRHTDRSHAPWL